MTERGTNSMEILRDDLEPGEDRRENDRGAPDGSERRSERATPIENSERSINRLGAVVGSTIVILAAVAGVTAYLPETRAHADETHAAIGKRLDDHDKLFDEQRRYNAAVDSRLGNMERTGLLSLQLQIQGRIADIDRELKGTPDTSGAGRVLVDSRIELKQQSDEIIRQLRK